MKKKIPKTMSFSIVFLSGFWMGLGKNLESVWEGFGGSWRLLGHFLASFFRACIQNALQKGSWRRLGSILPPFWRLPTSCGLDLGAFLVPCWPHFDTNLRLYCGVWAQSYPSRCLFFFFWTWGQTLRVVAGGLRARFLLFCHAFISGIDI